jgi:plastocyanin
MRNKEAVAAGHIDPHPAVVRCALTTALLLSSLFQIPSAGSLLHCQPAYVSVEVNDGGTITGKVRLKGIPPTCDQLMCTQDNRACGKTKRSPRLSVGNGLGIADAIVYLESISKGKKFQEEHPCLLVQHNCEYSPHTLIVPAGSPLQIVNNDPILHNVHTYEASKDPKTVFNIAQPIKGVKSTTKPLMKPGLINVSCDAGHPWMSASIMVAAHPYYTLTDKDGNFSLANVPPGSYTLRMWHEGVAIVKKELEHDKVKKYEFEQPYEESMQVTVNPKTTSTADFELTLR